MISEGKDRYVQQGRSGAQDTTEGNVLQVELRTTYIHLDGSRWMWGSAPSACPNADGQAVIGPPPGAKRFNYSAKAFGKDNGPLLRRATGGGRLVMTWCRCLWEQVHLHRTAPTDAPRLGRDECGLRIAAPARICPRLGGRIHDSHGCRNLVEAAVLPITCFWPNGVSPVLQTKLTASAARPLSHDDPPTAPFRPGSGPNGRSRVVKAPR
ncbi:hypothetical protein CALVIDRAFT_417267 [Calocera viscosa TUFC12733]|uniref:Uncharacterized protein n=1 Tax=Calocera viscosa (strain TUFC12733) TaxID=1330018 RepID=A0A167PG82_CALVF|nr:hypothetical protein CALVIDRAFT_417267 [Calocera viscosa TUFC12733]